MVPGTSLAAMFRFNAERGEYGDGDIEALVEERMAQADVYKRQPQDCRVVGNATGRLGSLPQGS